MRIIRLAPYIFELDRTEHVKNYVEIAKDEDFVNTFPTEEVDTLNYYIMNIEPSEEQSLWIRISREILDRDTGVTTIQPPTLELELVYTTSSFDRLSSDYVDNPTIKFLDEPIEPTVDENLDMYLVNNELTINTTEFRSDNPEFKYLQFLMVDNEGNVIKHIVDSTEQEVVVNFDGVDLYEHIMVYVAHTNVNDITSKFTARRVNTSTTLIYETLNLVPFINPNGPILFTVNNVSDSYLITLRDSTQTEVASSDTSILSIDPHTLIYNEDYVLTVRGEVNGKYFMFNPLSFSSRTSLRTELYTTSTVELMGSNELIYKKLSSDLPTTIPVHVDELNGLFVDVRGNRLVLDKLYVDEVTKEISFVEEIGINFLINGEFQDMGEVTKFFVHYLGQGRFLLDIEGDFGRVVMVYKHDVNRTVLRIDEVLLLDTTVRTVHTECEVLSLTKFVITKVVDGTQVLVVVTYNPITGLYSTSSTELVDNLELIEMLHRDDNHVVFMIAGTKYRYRISDMSRVEVGDNTNHPNYSIGFNLPSGEYLFVDTDNDRVLLDNGTIVGEYPTGETFNRTIRFETNVFMLVDETNNEGRLYGDNEVIFNLTEL